MIKIGDLYSEFKDGKSFYIIIDIDEPDNYIVLFLDNLNVIKYDATFVHEDAKL